MIYYKYCSWDENTKENIKKHQLFPSKSNSENDPFENLPCFDTDKWAKVIHERKQVKIPLIYAHINDFFYEFTKEVREHTYISLSKISDNILMWSHYANNHNGVCIGYDMSHYNPNGDKKLPLFDVIYSNKRVEWPTDFLDISMGVLENRRDLIEIVVETMITKSKCWEYEQESRLISINEGTIYDNIETSGIVKEVIIGCNVKDDEVKSIKEYVTSANSEIQIYQMKKDSKAFKLNKVLIK